MKKVGITGGIGSGKSTVCKIFETLEIPVFYSDEVAKALINNDLIVKQKIVDLLGESVISKSETLDRKEIAKIVFSDKEKLEKLNEIIHPAVASAFESWCKNQNAPFVLKEAAILFESGAYKQLDSIIWVSAPESMRIERVVQRDKSDKQDVINRIKNQRKEEELIDKADFVIYNDGKQAVIPQVLAIFQKLI